MRRPAALLALALAAGCGGRRDQFIEGRVLEPCDGQWPVCDRVAGCLVGGQSYVEGRFPGMHQVAVQLFEPSTVRVSFFLESIGAAGEETVINFFEDRCRTRLRQTVSGRTFVGEAEKVGYVAREVDLAGVGDHLIELESDAQARYLAKVDVIPTRLKTSQ